MRWRLITSLILSSSCLLLSNTSAAIGNSAAGQKKSTTCAACHGNQGESHSPQWPNLAAQGERYLYQQLNAFKKGKNNGRFDAVMTPLATPLTDQDMQDLAAFYKSQTAVMGSADKKLLQHGQQIYRGGNSQRNIPACIACHGPQGYGNNEAAFPLLSGQHPEYIVKQLQDYKNNTRTTGPNNIMQDIAGRMSTEDMQAVASYVAGLH